MLIRREILDQIVRRDIDLVFRRWTKPTVRTGGTLRTGSGLLGIERVDRPKASSSATPRANPFWQSNVAHIATFDCQFAKRRR